MRSHHRLTVAAALLTLCCRSGRDQDEETTVRARVDDQGRVVLTAQERAAVGLETSPAVEGSLTASALRFGRVVARPEDDALVTAPVTGRLIAPTVALGASVTAGEVVVALEPLVDTASRVTLEAQRRELQGQVEAARALVTAKRADLDRVATLAASGLATEADRAQAEAGLASEQARADSLQRAGGALAGTTGARLELRAPVPGILAVLASESGGLVQQGTIVARIVRAGPRWIDVAVPPGDPVGSGYRARGVAGTVSATLVTRGVVIQSDGTRRDRLEAAPEAAASLLPGATVPVEVLNETRGVVIAANAVVRRGRETLVFVEAAPGKYAAHRVKLAARDETHAVVSEGLTTRDRVVTRGASSLLGELGAAGGEPGAGARE